MTNVHEFEFKGATYFIRLLDDNSINILKGSKKICNIRANGSITRGEHFSEFLIEEIWKVIQEGWKFISSRMKK
jgi:hypothetical protein